MLAKESRLHGHATCALAAYRCACRRLPPPPVPAINRAIYSELARMGVNLNQLARAANEGRLDGLPLSFLSGVKQYLLTVQRAVLGQPHDRQTDQG